MEKSWKEWVNENLSRNCDPAGIAQILRDNKFSPGDIRELMGERFPETPLDAPKPQPASERNIAQTGSGALHAKRESLVAIRRSLARLLPQSFVVERRRGLSGEEFLKEYYAANRPVLLEGLMTDWPAMRKWTPEYLKQTCGDQVVEIMAARDSNPEYEIEDAPHRRQVKFSQFIDMVTGGKETNDYYLTARNAFFTLPGMRPLLQDFISFPHYLKSDPGGSGIFFWFGPKGTITPLHHDEMNIIMAQVSGRKRIILIPADELDLIYNHYAVYSQVNYTCPDYERFPKFRDATVMEVELAPGEALFLPVGWWHYVQSLDQSMTVTFNNFIYPNSFQWAHPQGFSKE